MMNNNGRLIGISAAIAAVVLTLLAWWNPGQLIRWGANQTPPAQYQAPELVSTPGHRAFLPQLESDKAGGMHLVWVELDGQKGSALFYRHWANGQWSELQKITTSHFFPVSVSLATDSTGRPHVVFGTKTGEMRHAYYMRPVGQNTKEWTNPLSVVYGTNPHFNPKLVIDPQDTMHLALQITSGHNSAIAYRQSLPGAATTTGETQRALWNDAEVVTQPVPTATFWMPHLSTTPSGQALMTYFMIQKGGGQVQFTRRAINAATWSEPVVIMPEQWGNTRPMVVAAGNNLHVVWEDVTREGRFVYHSTATAAEATTPGGWSDPEEISNSDHLGYDSALMTLSDGQVALVWYEEVKEEGNVTWMNVWHNGDWKDPVRLSWNEENALGASLTEVNGQLFAAWSHKPSYEQSEVHFTPLAPLLPSGYLVESR